MPLETATYISDLVTTNPAHSDNISQADSHMRLLKSVLKNQFPNFTAAALASTNANIDAAVATANGTTGLNNNAWTSYTPTLSAASGTFTSASATGYYKQIGKTVFVRGKVVITNGGSASLWTYISLPVAASATETNAAMVTGWSQDYTSTMGGMLQDTTKLRITKYDGTSGWNPGPPISATFWYAATYEAA